MFLKRAVIFLMILSLALSSISGTADAARKKHTKRTAHRSAPARPQPDRYAHIIIDAASGTILSEKNADKQLYPASLSKMMTLYLAFEAINNGRLRKNDRIPVSSHAASQDPSKLGLQPGGSIRVEDAILGIVTKSANDAAVAMGEALAQGSEARFGALMTAKARQLGMKNTRFVNASGLFNTGQISSARDMAILAIALMRDFPSDYRYFSTPSFTYAGTLHKNHNKLMATYPGMDGLKTGFVSQSGYNLAASARRNGRRLVGVIFGGTTAVSRNNQMTALLNDGFMQLQNPAVLARINARVAASTAPATAPAQVAAASQTAPRPVRNDFSDDVHQFDAMGLVTQSMQEQGDETEAADDTAANVPISAPRVIHLNAQPVQKPSIAVTTPAAPVRMASAAAPVPAANDNWTVQIGAYSTHTASMNALRDARGKLPAAMTGSSRYVIAPLMTNRGMIYRARLSGLNKETAANTCRILGGNCLVLAIQ